MPKVSIIIPIYNIEKYLKQCLESCINQTLQDIEIICVNDGSTDNCQEIINEYAENENNKKVLKAYLRYCCFSLFYWYKILPQNTDEKLKFKKLMIFGLEKAKKYDYRIHLYLLLLKMNIFSLYYLVKKSIYINKLMTDYILKLFLKTEFIQ